MSWFWRLSLRARLMIIGLTEVMIIGYLPNGSQYKDAVAFVILIVILLVKPTGLLGRNVAEKV